MQYLNTLRTRVNSSFEKVLTKLGTHRSSIGSINSLPDEILSKTFSIAGGNGHDYKANLAITHTCAKWRTICLEIPSLWQCVDLDRIPLKLTKLYTTRNTTIPWTFTLINTSPDEKNASRFKLLVNHMKFTKRLCIRAKLPMSWLGSGRHGAPILESLELQTSDGLGMLPSPFVAFLSLRELTLKGVLLPKDSSAYIGLRKLHIEYSGTIEKEKRLHLRSLLTACSDLEELTIRSTELWHVFEDMNVSGDPREDPVQMPHLSSVTLELFAKDLYRILFLMALPPTARIQLRVVRHSKSEKTAFSDILPLDPRCIPSLRHACKLQVCRGYPPRFVVSRIRYTVDDETPMIDDEPFLDIEPTHYSSLSKINSMVNLLQHLPHIHHIDFGGCYDYNSADHLALARMLPLLRTLHLWSLTLKYLRAWTAQIKHSPNPLWPHLRHLVLSWTNLEGDCEDLVAFCQALRNQMQTLDLRQCRMSSLEQENILLEKLRGLGIPSVTCIDSRYPDPQ